MIDKYHIPEESDSAPFSFSDGFGYPEDFIVVL